jgi:hypothetical protein
MAAREHQPETIIADAVLRSALTVRFPVTVAERRHGDLLELRTTGARPPHPIDGPVAGGGLQPAGRTDRNAIPWPALERLGERVLGTLLGQVPVAGDPDEMRDDASPLGPKRIVDRGPSRVQICQIGLTSIVPMLAAGFFDATSMASSKSLHSTM